MRRSKPRHVGAVIRLGAMTVPPFTRLLFRVQWREGNAIPASGPAIVVANHVSYIDPLVIATFIWHQGRIPRFLGKQSLFELPLLGRLLRRAGQIPVSRGTRDAAHSLHAAVDGLRRGEIIVIYPEGTVTRDGDFWPMAGRTGAARLALLTPGVPLIPVGQWGSQDAVDVYHHRYRPLPRKTVTVSVGGAVDLGRFAGQEPNAENLRAVTELIMTAITDEVAVIRGVEPPTGTTAA